MPLYLYQSKAIEEIRTHYRNGVRRVLLHLATGGGKTHIFSHVLKETANKGHRCMMVVRGRQLVDQASQRLFHEGVHHGVRMYGHWNKNYSANVQVCSIDTLTARKEYPDAKLIVIDEAHMATSEGYKTLVEQYPDAFFLAVTATPYTDKPLSHVASVIVQPISVSDLIDQGFLLPPRYFGPSRPDLTGVKTVNKDYENAELEVRMEKLTGDIIQHWIRLGENRPTLCFAVNIHHSRSIVDRFNASGIPAAHIEAENSLEERQSVVQKLKRGELKVISNVGVMCTGVDIPFLSCLIMARPTKSLNLYIQQAGRGTRTCPETGKKDFLILDHAGNIDRHGYITDEHPADLEGRSKIKALGVKTCKLCYLIYREMHCPDCGPVCPKCVKLIEECVGHEAPDLILEEGEGELVEREVIKDPVLRFIEDAKITAHRRGYKRGWVYFAVKDKFGEEVANQYFQKNPYGGFFQRKVPLCPIHLRTS